MLQYFRRKDSRSECRERSKPGMHKRADLAINDQPKKLEQIDIDSEEDFADHAPVKHFKGGKNHTKKYRKVKPECKSK